MRNTSLYIPRVREPQFFDFSLLSILSPIAYGRVTDLILSLLDKVYIKDNFIVLYAKKV